MQNHEAWRLQPTESGSSDWSCSLGMCNKAAVQGRLLALKTMSPARLPCTVSNVVVYCTHTFHLQAYPRLCVLQADARSKLGERCTAFEQVVNGSKTLQRGDLVRLAVKPALVGRIQFFSVAQVRKFVGTRQHGQAACAWWRELVAQPKLC